MSARLSNLILAVCTVIAGAVGLKVAHLTVIDFGWVRASAIWVPAAAAATVFVRCCARLVPGPSPR